MFRGTLKITKEEGKGKLGEAMVRSSNEQRQAQIAKKMIVLMEKCVDMAKITVKSTEELFWD